MNADLKQILSYAEEKGVAVPAFNCYNVESVMASPKLLARPAPR